MPGIQPINQGNSNKPLLTAHNTGKMALVGMGATCVTAMVKSKKAMKKKINKIII